MIDNPGKTEWLLGELESVLPFETRVSPQLAMSLQDSVPGLQPLQLCHITGLFYTGDEGGILCVLDLKGAVEREVILVSITHLVFDRRLPLARHIAAYQKHRAKHVRRETGTGLTLSQMTIDPRRVF